MEVYLDGHPKTVYGTGWNYMHGTDLQMASASGTYLLETPYMDPYSFFTPNLLGATVEFDVDLSARNCGCVAAFYLVKMPGRHEDGSLWNTDGSYYCDANQVGGNFCPEMDIMEANQWAFQTTPHSCDAPTSNGFYYSCDKGGICGRNFKNLDYNVYGPGSQFQINTLEWFHVRIEFGNNSDDEYQWFTTTLYQNGNSAQITGNCDSNRALTEDLRQGMTFAITNWSTYDNWLWGDKCQAQAC
jgi:hypothetical protein